MADRERDRAARVWQVLLLGSMILMLGLVLETDPGPTVATALVVVGLVLLVLRGRRAGGG